MITAGIDMGAKTIKVVIMQDEKIISRSIGESGFDQRSSAEKIFDEALSQAKMSRNDIEHITVTGIGRKEIIMHPPISADREVTEVTASAKGIIYLFPSVRTVIDVGAEEGRAIRCDATGRVIDFAVNEKCAAGAGSFTEAMSRALEVPFTEMGELSLKSQQVIPMNAQCAVFAESEVVSLVHAKTPKEDIARAVNDAVASRIASMTRRIGMEKDIALIGGVSKNNGFVKSLKDNLQVDIITTADGEFVGAIGAALMAER
ncbi:MAG: acyl-CoA dehydratase activase [Planctomycetota bacterium]|nr:acyl-CoA dehydratase activase [Planctomycetota bacterium]